MSTSRQQWPTGLHALYTPPQMRVVLHRERLRADRGDTEVAATLFELVNGTRRQCRRLARLLLRRARATDHVGWVSADQLCAVLPDTAGPGAHHFAAAVCTLAERRGLDVRYTVYTNGHDEEDDDAFPPSAGGGSADLRRANTTAPASPASPASPFRGGAGPDVIAAPAATGDDANDRRRPKTTAVSPRLYATTGPDRVALPLELLLSEPMPAWKRATDIAGASVGLALTAPLMAAAALMIRLSSSGPVLFRQWRAGLHGTRFTILKFRTMVPDAERLKPALRALSEQDGPAFKMTNDPRVTLVGRILRATSLDELPQFWNVLKGHMSLVGPRPLPVQEAEACGRWQRRRLDVVPGLTCIWQVRGRSRVTFDDWMRMDMEYMRNRSFLYDLKLLLLTVPAVILRRGAH